MKKSAGKIARAAWLVYAFVIAFNIPDAAAQLPFNDGFESGNFITGGWTVSGGAQVSTQSPSQGLYCAQGPASWGLIKTIPSITDTMVFVEFDVKASQTNTTCLIFRIRDAGGLTSAGFFMNNLGQIMGVNGPTPAVVLLNYSVDQWYKIRFELSMNSQTYDIYIDNILLANDFNFYSSGFYMPQDFSWSSVAATGSAWIDGVSIFSGILTGTDNISSAHRNVCVFPNPVTEKLTVEMKYSEQCHAVMYNLHGIKILYQPFKKTDSIELAGFAAGIYFLTITDETGSILYSEKILKQ